MKAIPSNFNHVRVPTAVYLLREDGILTARDTDLVGFLLSYKNKVGTTVWPKLSTLAARSKCCTKTIQRAVDRLEAAGLITTQYLRDARGRIKSLIFDLAPLIEMTKKKATAAPRKSFSSLPSESLGASEAVDGNHAQNGGSGPVSGDSLQDSGVGTLKQDSDVQASSPARQHSEAVHEIARLLRNIKMGVVVAYRLAAEHSEQRIRAVLAYVERRKNVGNRAAYVYQLLTDSDFAMETVPPSPTPRPAAPVPASATPGKPGERFDLLPKGSKKQKILTLCYEQGFTVILDEMEARHRLSLERREMQETIDLQKDALEWLRTIASGETNDE